MAEHVRALVRRDLAHRVAHVVVELANRDPAVLVAVGLAGPSAFTTALVNTDGRPSPVSSSPSNAYSIALDAVMIDAPAAAEVVVDVDLSPARNRSPRAIAPL